MLVIIQQEFLGLDLMSVSELSQVTSFTFIFPVPLHIRQVLKRRLLGIIVQCFDAVGWTTESASGL